MKTNRIYAIVLRHAYNFIHTYDRLTDAFYWPIIDLVLWGITLSYLRTQITNSAPITYSILGGILFWIATWRGQYEISINVLTELWDRNMLNLFVSPLKFSEWITSLVLLGIAKTAVSLTFAAVVALVLYKFNVLTFGFYLIPFLFLLLMSGWWVGFLLAAALVRFGSKIQTIAWTLPWALAPFSAIFFPKSILPQWAQTISDVLPMSYIFEGAREVIIKQHFDPGKVYIAFALNLLYVCVAIIFFRASFKKALERGLQTLY